MREANEFARKEYELELTDNLEDVLAILPPHLGDAITALGPRRAGSGLIEIVMDLGRPPEARFQDGEADLSDRDVSRQDLAHVAERIGRFGDDNRAGVERTLHRISAIRNRGGDIVGLTCRVGRAVYGHHRDNSRPDRVRPEHPAPWPARRRQDHDAARDRPRARRRSAEARHHC